MQQDVIRTQMRNLKRQLDTGRIDVPTYEAQFSALNRSVGTRCTRCRTGTATIRRGRRSLCAACVLRPSGRYRLSRLVLALVVVLAIGFALIYVASV